MIAKHRPYWVIVVGATPTAFRSRRRETLVPTLRQLQRTQPDTQLMYFDRGRFWRSEEESRERLAADRRAREARSAERSTDWRPGGGHRDPRARPKVSRDERRARFKKRLVRKNSTRPSGGSASAGKPAGPARRTRGRKK